MTKCEIIDTFPAFLAYWTKAQNKPLDAQVEIWAGEPFSVSSVNSAPQWFEACGNECAKHETPAALESIVDWRTFWRRENSGCTPVGTPI
jgi:hypothetical protein